MIKCNNYDYADHRQAAAHFAALSIRASDPVLMIAYARIAQSYATLADTIDRMPPLNGGLESSMPPRAHPGRWMLPPRNREPVPTYELAGQSELMRPAEPQ